jgi:hypothetical protein
MKATNKAARLQGRIADYVATVDRRKGDTRGLHKPGAGSCHSFGHQGPGKKGERGARTQVVHQRLRDLAKKFPENPDLRRYL